MSYTLVASLAFAMLPADGATPVVDSRKAYVELRAASGRDADAQVSLALWCEAHGLEAERLKHLSIAVLTDPAHATARGLLGLVEYRGKWAKPDAVAAKLKADETLNRAMIEYNARRDKLKDRADDHMSLALWCEAHGLKSEATVHFMNVTRLDPSRESAWKHLGCKKYNGVWMAEDQIAAVKAETEAQRAADKRWGMLLAKWKGWLGDKRRRSEAEAKLAEVTDPRALPAVWSVFATDSPAGQKIAAGVIGQMDGETASRHLAFLAVKGVTPEIRRIANESLQRRDPREYLDTLISFLTKPLKFEVRPVGGPGSPGVLFVEGEKYNVRRVYDPPTGFAPLPQRPTNARGVTEASFESQTRTVIERNIQAAATNTAIAQNSLANDVAQLEATNVEIGRSNEATLTILADVTGQKLGEDPKAWRAWWTDQKGYAFVTSDEPKDKPTFDQFVPIQSVQARGYDCFAAGTPVRTLDGLRPIESIRTGDQVLTQDAKSGKLEFRPVVTAFRYQPSQTLRIQCDSDAIVATGIHRFWKVGRGWVMARELKSGDEIRTLGGKTRVVSVAADKVQPVYNLEMHGGVDYFVGRNDALVHDHSLVAPTLAPFDAPRKSEVATASN
jgi:hypothetical protein